MNLRFWSFRCGLALAGLLLSPPAASVAADSKPAPRRAIELSETNSFDILSTLRNQANGPRILEDDFTRALPNGGSRGSLDGVAAPVYYVPRVAQPRRSKDPLNQQPAWLKQGNLVPGNDAASDLLQNSGLADEATRKKKSATEQFYRRLRAEDSRDIDSLAGDDSTGARRRLGLLNPDSKENASLPSGLRNSEEKLRNLLLGDDSTSAPVYGGTHPSTSDFFGVGSTGPSPAQLDAQKAYMEEYRKLWQASSPLSTPFNPLDPLGSRANPSGSAASLVSPTYKGMDDVASTAGRNAGVGLPATMDSVMHPPTLPDLNAPLNQWNPLYVPRKTEEVKPAASGPISVPMMEVPRRRFP